MSAVAGWAPQEADSELELRCRMFIRENPWHQPLQKGAGRAGLGGGRPGSSLQGGPIFRVVEYISTHLLPSNITSVLSYSSRGQKSKITVLSGLHFFWKLREKICFLAVSSFLPLPAFQHSWPLLHLQRQQTHQSDLCFYRHVSVCYSDPPATLI